MDDAQNIPIPPACPAPDTIYDLVIIGGGVNGCGIARDAAGRGLKVLLAEMNDLASATSSASTKLFHGGLRYLEHYKFRLVREALIERETLLTAMPHISWPMRFVLPIMPSGLPGGGRPAWLLRLGLFVYDHLGGRRILPATRTLKLANDPAGAPLKPILTKAFEYSDCWVEDARLVILNARDAARLGADIRTQTLCETATREGAIWRVTLLDKATGKRSTVTARGLVNAAGPWVNDVLGDRLGVDSKASARLVRGSHIVTRRLFDHDKCYFLQQPDGRIIFAIPYESDFTLIGTTDVDHDGDAPSAHCTQEEQDYLLAAASLYFEKPLTTDDIVWTYSGVRPLYDDGAASASAATRDYVLNLVDETGKAPLLNVFGGKITTYRRLSEEAMALLAPFYPGPDAERAWTARARLPGGDFPVDGVPALIARLQAQYPFLGDAWARRLIRAYGTEAFDVLGESSNAAALGQDFGWTLTAREIDWLMDQEWALTADDVLWRRSKLGLRLSAEQAAEIQTYMDQRRNG